MHHGDVVPMAEAQNAQKTRKSVLSNKIARCAEASIIVTGLPTTHENCMQPMIDVRGPVSVLRYLDKIDTPLRQNEARLSALQPQIWYLKNTIKNRRPHRGRRGGCVRLPQKNGRRNFGALSCANLAPFGARPRGLLALLKWVLVNTSEYRVKKRGSFQREAGAAPCGLLAERCGLPPARLRHGRQPRPLTRLGLLGHGRLRRLGGFADRPALRR
jgi:hypothetical protein